MTGQPQQQPSAPKLAVPPTVFGSGPAVVAPPQINAYLRTRVMSAKPEELRLLLIEGAIKFAQQGRMGVESKQFEQAFIGLTQAREIAVELMTSVKSEPNPELAEKVRAIYGFIYTQLVEGGFEKDLKKLDNAIALLEYERETWLLLMQQLTTERGQATEQSAMLANIAEGKPGASLPTTPVAATFEPTGTIPKPTYQARPTLSLQG